jgi:hypothetical protein
LFRIGADIFVSSLGESHTLGHLYSSNIISHAVMHKRLLISNNHVQSQYVVCTRYKDANKNKIKQIYSTIVHNFELHYSYLSAREDLACFISHFSPSEVSLIENEPKIEILLIEPIPTLLKLDLSVHRMQSIQYFPQNSPNLSKLRVNHPIIEKLQQPNKKKL